MLIVTSGECVIVTSDVNANSYIDDWMMIRAKRVMILLLIVKKPQADEL